MEKLRNLMMAIFIIATVNTMAQVPQSLNYQAVARNSTGALIANHPVSLRLSILSGSSTGTVVYSETQSATTNQFGLFTLSIGTGTPVSGTFNTINWSTGQYWLKAELDATGGSSYVAMGTSQLLSVPFALYAANAGTSGITGATGPTGPAGTAGNAWQTTGNTGTVDGTNFIGTADNVPLSFRVNNSQAGRIDNSLYNTFFGYLAGNSSTGNFNVANGTAALYSNTSGNYNTAIGVSALYYNSIAANNTAIGDLTLLNNTTSGHNTALGNYALFSQSFDNGGTLWNSDNVAVGYYSLYANQPTSTINGIQNTAVGDFSLQANTYGYNNTSVGYQTLYSNTTGYENTANGYQALYTNTTGIGNTALGYIAYPLNANISNYTGIGFTVGNGSSISNSVEVGNTSVGWIGGQVAWSTYSD